MTLVGALVFAAAIAVSIMLHEAGHLLTAKSFGMKATQYFVGFGPTLFSRRRGETEYGVKAIPAGGFVKIVGMTPLEEVPPEDEPRAFYRQPALQRVVVLAAGSVTHFILAAAVVFGAALTTGVPVPADQVRVSVPQHVLANWDVVRQNGQQVLREPGPSDPLGPAYAAGLRDGDEIVSIDGRPVNSFNDLRDAIRASGGAPVSLVVRADNGPTRTVTVDPIQTQRPASGVQITQSTDLATVPLQEVPTLGVGLASGNDTLQRYGPIGAIERTGGLGKDLVTGTFTAIAKFPSKIGKLVDALGGGVRDPETPISVVGASRLGGEALAAASPAGFLLILASLNVFIGIFNLFPLLPLDGGHIAVLAFEKARSGLARAFGRRDPGRVDIRKLLPVTYVVVLIGGGVSLLAIAADVVNPIANPFGP